MIRPITEEAFGETDEVEFFVYYKNNGYLVSSTAEELEWEDILGPVESWYSKGYKVQYELYLKWHNRHFTKLGKYLYESIE